MQIKCVFLSYSLFFTKLWHAKTLWDGNDRVPQTITDYIKNFSWNYSHTSSIFFLVATTYNQESLCFCFNTIQSKLYHSVDLTLKVMVHVSKYFFHQKKAQNKFCMLKKNLLDFYWSFFSKSIFNELNRFIFSLFFSLSLCK